jgi:hypothetical protein
MLLLRPKPINRRWQRGAATIQYFTWLAWLRRVSQDIKGVIKIRINVLSLVALFIYILSQSIRCPRSCFFPYKFFLLGRWFCLSNKAIFRNRNWKYCLQKSMSVIILWSGRSMLPDECINGWDKKPTGVTGLVSSLLKCFVNPWILFLEGLSLLCGWLSSFWWRVCPLFLAV